MAPELLIIFTKNPVLGRVKTRLAKTIGAEPALKIFKKLLAQAAKTALSWSGDVWVFYADFLPKKDLWSPVADKVFLQQGEDLGERMKYAFEQGFKGYKKVVLIGTDIPSISKEVIEEAFRKLEQKDMVLGPTYDGGYYLIGMNAPNYYVFEKMAWSTPTVLEETIDKIHEQEQDFSLTPRLVDVDNESDLVGFEWLLQDE